MNSKAKAALVIIDTGKSWLLQRRDDKDGIWWPGKVGCWGGAVEAGDDSPLEAAYRELNEELELSPDQIKLAPVLTKTLPFMGIHGESYDQDYYYYVCEVIDPSRFLHVYEGSGIVEIPYDFELSSPDMSFSPNVIPVLEELQRRKRDEK